MLPPSTARRRRILLRDRRRPHARDHSSRLHLASDRVRLAVFAPALRSLTGDRRVDVEESERTGFGVLSFAAAALVVVGGWAAVVRQATQGFMTTEVVGKMATRANVKTVVLTHLCCSPRPGNDDYTPRAEEVKKHFSGQVLIATDLMEF